MAMSLDNIMAPVCTWNGTPLPMARALSVCNVQCSALSDGEDRLATTCLERGLLSRCTGKQWWQCCNSRCMLDLIIVFFCKPTKITYKHKKRCRLNRVDSFMNHLRRRWGWRWVSDLCKYALALSVSWRGRAWRRQRDTYSITKHTCVTDMWTSDRFVVVVFRVVCAAEESGVFTLLLRRKWGWVV